MGLSASTLRWSSIVAEEAGAVSMPYGCLLRLIQRESGGRPGLTASSSTAHCGTALGLCQITDECGLFEYNKRNPGAVIPRQRLLGTDTLSARLQIRAGAFLWMMGHARWKGEVSSDYDRAVLADLAYARGSGNLSKLIKGAKAAGYPITLSGLRSFSPDWGKPEKPFSHASFVADGVIGTSPSPLSGVDPSSSTVAVLIALVAAVGLFLALVGSIK